jgi:hypothetical protein
MTTRNRTTRLSAEQQKRRNAALKSWRTRRANQASKRRSSRSARRS